MNMNYYRKAVRLVGAILAVTMMLTNPMQAQCATVKSDQDSICVRGALVWPSQDMEFLDYNKEVICKIKAGTPVKAFAETNGYMKVYYNKRVGLLDSSLCMINLADAMQPEMLFDITNSYSSKYKIHQNDITDVTGEVLYPYAMTDEGTFLVPLLYPVAVKLYEAEADALERGYTLKIYDAYRPYEVSTYIYQKTTEFIEENPIYGEYIEETIKGVTYSQSNFLAKSASNHNYGVALDLTLADLETGEELQMQSDMHELSPWSVRALNNDNANLLSEIMLAHGFRGLNSEWWHFDIREYRQKVATFQASK